MWIKWSSKIKNKVILEVSLDLKIYFIFCLLVWYEKILHLSLCCLFLTKKSKTTQRTPGFSWHIFLGTAGVRYRQFWLYFKFNSQVIWNVKLLIWITMSLVSNSETFDENARLFIQITRYFKSIWHRYSILFDIVWSLFCCLRLIVLDELVLSRSVLKIKRQILKLEDHVFQS